jgi:putative transposase
VARPDLGDGRRRAASSGAWIVVEDEAGATGRPPTARTWGLRGHPSQLAVSGRGGRVSMAALVCYRPGCRGRLFYRILVHRRRAGERRSFSEDHYAALVAAAHVQLQAPIILIWDNCSTCTAAPPCAGSARRTPTG